VASYDFDFTTSAVDDLNKLIRHNPALATQLVTETDDKNEMGKDAFLKLLLTQLQYQDPLNPMDGVEFTGQLAEFTSLEQLYNINSNFSGMNTMLTAQYNFGTINLVGKEVKAQGDMLSVADGASTKGIVGLEADAAKVNVAIYNSEGILVRTLELGAMSAGANPFEWDAKDYKGNTMKDGNYTFEVTAMDGADQTLETTTGMLGRVTGVTFLADGSATLLLNSMGVALADVFEVVEPAAATD